MVKLSANAFISFLSLATLGLSAPSCSQPHVKRSADSIVQIKTDIVNIAGAVNVLNAAVDAFPTTGASLTAALAINTQVRDITVALEKGTGDVTSNGAIAFSDGQSILNSFQGLADPVHHTLVVIVDKKSAFTAIPVGNVRALILQDLKLLRSNTSDFANALIASSAAPLTSPATDLRNTILGFFDVAIAAYSN